MNNNLQIFENDKFGKIRTISLNSEPWFVAADLCRALQINSPTDAITRLEDDEHALVSIEGINNGTPVNVVNEPGMYSLVLGSRKKEAKAFKRWVTHDILPTLRKTGTYSTQGQMAPAQPTMAIVKEMELRFKVMEKMGCSPYEIAGMMTSMDKAYGIAVSKVLADQLDPQLCLFDAPALPADAPLLLS